MKTDPRDPRFPRNETVTFRTLAGDFPRRRDAAKALKEEGGHPSFRSIGVVRVPMTADVIQAKVNLMEGGQDMVTEAKAMLKKAREKGYWDPEARAFTSPVIQALDVAVENMSLVLRDADFHVNYSPDFLVAEIMKMDRAGQEMAHSYDWEGIWL